MRAAEWLERHTLSITRPGDELPVRIIAWKDPTLEPKDLKLLAGYVITDMLWAAKALKPIDWEAAREMESGIRRLGWAGNGLQDVPFHPLDQIMHCPADEDYVHGHSLGRFPANGGRTVDLRVFRQKWDPKFDVGIRFSSRSMLSTTLSTTIGRVERSWHVIESARSSRLVAPRIRGIRSSGMTGPGP